MRLPSTDELVEARRGLAVLAALAFVLAVFLPMWAIDVHAVQYPDQVLHLHIYAYPHISGDYVEMHRLNKYIGFYYPDPVYWQPNYPVHEHAVKVPEWSVGPVAFLAVAALSVFVAIAPTGEKLRRGLRWQLVGTIAVFVVMLVDIQYRLYQTGHSLDPDAPVMGVEGFTPPIWGKYAVANITSYSHLDFGAYLSMLAIALLVLAYHFRTTDATIREVPGLLSEEVGRVRDDPSRLLDGTRREPRE
ncbi:MAG: hypothetical protein ABEJ81_02085 [Haloferacaceae archaeon]